MPRLWIFSDLHQEWPENAWDAAAHAPPDGFDVAVVPGDIHTPLTASVDWLLLQVGGGPALHHCRFAPEDRALLDVAVERRRPSCLTRRRWRGRR